MQTAAFTPFCVAPHKVSAAGGVFCSFSSADYDFAHDIALTIADHSFLVWFDRFRITEIGTKLTPEIEQAIAASSCVVAVVSASAHRSLWMRKEIDAAQRLNRPVLQVVRGEAAPLPGLEDEAVAHITRDGLERSLSRLIGTIERIAARDFEDAAATPLIPIFLEAPNQIDSGRLQRRLALLDTMVDRLAATSEHIVFSVGGDEVPQLVRRLESGGTISRDDPLLRQTLDLVEKEENRVREGIADIVSNLHRLRMFRGGGVGYWSVFTSQAIAEYVKTARSFIMAQLLLLIDMSFAERFRRGKTTRYITPNQYAHDPGRIIGRKSQRFDVFHKGERKELSFPGQLWQAREPHTVFSAPEDGELAGDVQRYFHVEASDYPYDLSDHIVPQMLLQRFLDPSQVGFWDFDDCAIGPH